MGCGLWLWGLGDVRIGVSVSWIVMVVCRYSVSERLVVVFVLREVA